MMLLFASSSMHLISSWPWRKTLLVNWVAKSFTFAPKAGSPPNVVYFNEDDLVTLLVGLVRGLYYWSRYLIFPHSWCPFLAMQGILLSLYTIVVEFTNINSIELSIIDASFIWFIICLSSLMVKLKRRVIGLCDVGNAGFNAYSKIVISLHIY